MKRTTIHLPNDLRLKAKRVAKKRGVSLADLMRKALEKELVAEAPDPYLFLRVKPHPGRPDTPTDLSVSYEKYLYGEET